MFLKAVIGVCLVSYCFLGYYHVLGSFSIGALLVLFLGALFLVRGSGQGWIQFDGACVVALSAALSLGLLESFVNQDLQFQYFVSYLTAFLLFYVFYTIGRISVNINVYVRVFFWAILTSSLVSLLQAFEVDVAWSLRQMMPATVDLMVTEQIESRLKPPGLAYYSVQLSYQVTVICILLLAFPNLKLLAWISNNKIIWSLGACSAITGTLSALLSILIMQFLRGFWALRARSLIFVFALFMVVGPTLLYTLMDSLELSATKLSRVTFALIAMIIAYNNIWGVAKSDILVEKVDAVAWVSSYDLPFSEAVLDTSFHNTFLNVLVNAGILGFAIYVAFYIYVIYWYHRRKRVSGSEVRILAWAGYVGLFSYLAQCLTHNAGPFTSDPYFWIVNGLIMGRIVRLQYVGNCRKPI
jgi:hypothetical protein